MINIVDVGIGNTKSIKNWLYYSKLDSELLTRPDEYSGGAIILPGVACSANLLGLLREKRFDKLISSAATNGTLIVGICAGFQALGNYTREGKGARGLGLLPVTTEKISSDINHSIVGWRSVEIDLSHIDPKFKSGFGRRYRLKGRAFFNHSFGVTPEKKMALPSSNWLSKTGSHLNYFIKENIIGFQFHPEKSAHFGRVLAEIFR